MSLHRINQWSADQQRAVYARLVPESIYAHVAGLDPQRWHGGGMNPQVLRIDAPPDLSRVHLRVPASPVQGDHALLLELEEAGAGQLELAFVTINDLTGPRFDIDRDELGRPTLLGTAWRHRAEEARALAAGLGPCQVRRGLRAFSTTLGLLDEFARQAGYVAIRLEALTYHVAIMYENAGYAYLSGHKRMRAIDAAFAPGGELHRAMDGSSPFRSPALADTPRGRAWAIHDGVLTHLDGEQALKLEMVKVVGTRTDHRTFGRCADTTRPPA